MLLTRKGEALVAGYYKGTLTEEERKMVEEWDKESVEICGTHLLDMPLTPEQEDLLERCRQHNLTAEEKKQVLQLNQQSIDYCESDLLSGAMERYCLSED